MKNNKLNSIENSGFKVPDDYFKGLEDTVLAEAKLKSLVSVSGFITPEDYLENFNVSFKKETKVISLFSKKKVIYFSSIAAALVLFLSLHILNNGSLSFKDLDITTVDNYILNETEIEDLTYLFQDNQLSENQFIEYSLSDDALDSYLEATDINDLYLE